MLILLREQFLANAPGGSAPFVKISDYYDDIVRGPYTTRQDAQTNTPRFELALNATISTYDYRPGKTRVVYYDGNGGYYTRNLPPGLPSAGISYLQVKAGPGPLFTSNPGLTDACVDLTGQYGLPPYQITLRGTTGPATGYLNQGATSPSELYPVRYYNLAEGGYVATVVDALGHSATLGLTITPGLNRAMGKLLNEDAHSVSQSLHWSYNGQNVQPYANTANRDTDYQLPYGALVDGFFTLSTTNWRRVYSDGVFGGVYYEDFVLSSSSTLALHNLIQFHPDTPAEQNGGLVVEMDFTDGPLTYVLTGMVGGVAIAPVTNATGIFDGLAAGEYEVAVTDARRVVVTVPVVLKDRYGLRWQLLYDDLYGTPLRMELWVRGYTGLVEDLCMTGTPVEYSSDGLSSSIGGQGDIPPVIGSEVKLNFLVDTDLFEPVITSSFTDRFCRADIYYNNRLEWRGFVRPDSYDAPMLSGPQTISISATDGLASLKDTLFTGQQGQRLIGHRPMLFTLLSCLSRCEVALPLRLFANRRELSMASNEAPELFATTNRTGYWDEDKNEPLDMRTVVDAICQALGGTLVQREGTWQLRSALEASKAVPGRAYLPAGTAVGLPIVDAPLAAVEPPGFKHLYWLNAEQVKNIRAGWKSLTGKTDVGYLENAYPAGKAFSDKYSWLGYGTGGLQPVSGWRPSPGYPFPAFLVPGGDKGNENTTKWPRSGGYSTFEPLPYLEGPTLPLAPGLEAVPATIQFTGRFVPEEYWLDSDGNRFAAPTNAAKAVLTYELIVDGLGSGQQFVEFELGSSETAKEITVSAPLPDLPSGAVSAELRLYGWYAADTLLLNKAPTLVALKRYKKGDVVRLTINNQPHLYIVRLDDGVVVTAYTEAVLYELTPTNGGLGSFYLSEVAVQLTPQNATWEGEDNFRADGPAGNIRPTEVLEVTHTDPPRRAGLVGGNLFAFGKAVGLADGTPSTSWARPGDLASSPLFEGNVLDGLALRANPSRLVTGDLRYQNGVPVRLLDALDLPYDGKLAGRRFLVVAVSPWDMKAAELSQAKLVEIGVGQGAPDPLLLLPVGARSTHRLYQYLPGQYAPYVRQVHGGGVRVTHP